MSTPRTRLRPNILITGTPGSGMHIITEICYIGNKPRRCIRKSTLAPKIAQNLGFDFIDIAKIIKENEFYDGYDKDYATHNLDEDKLLDFLQYKFDEDEGGLVVDYHSCDFFPKRWFDLIIILRCSNTVLYDRLSQRKYSKKKLTENIDCEIFGVVAEQARESYNEEIIHELVNDTLEDQSRNVTNITNLISTLKK